VAGSFKSQLWMAYLSSFWIDGASSPELFTTYVGNSWNQHHSGGERLDSVEFSAMIETVSLGSTKSPAKRSLIWVEWF
jgi:hypothetical protein